MTFATAQLRATQLWLAQTDQVDMPADLDRDKYTSILGNVAQITLYVPDAIAKKLRADARRAKKSLSAYVTELAAGRRASGFPKWFLELEGSCKGTLVTPDDPPPDEPDAL